MIYADVAPSGRILLSGTTNLSVEALATVPLSDGAQRRIFPAAPVDPAGWYVTEDDELVAIPQPPSEHHEFDYAARQWIDQRTLPELRATAHDRIERWRDAQERTEITFEHGGHTWDGGLVTRQRLMPLLSLSSLPAGFFWTDADNNDVAMTLSELKELADAHEIAIVSRGFAIHVRQREMKEEILTMTAEQLAAFVPDWPPEEP